MTAVAEFYVCPETVDARSTIASVASTIETGHSRARATVERPFLSWTLRWSAASRETVSEIRRLVGLSVGGALTFDWTPPGGSQIEVRLARSGIRIDWQNAVTARVEVDLEEIR